jgi:hypothetical protein
MAMNPNPNVLATATDVQTVGAIVQKTGRTSSFTKLEATARDLDVNTLA